MTTNQHAIYRFRDRRNDLLYIGRTNSPIRRTYEHTLDKDWITTATRIDLEWVPADQVCELERRAIESEHPRYNVVHNRGRVKVKIQAEVSVPDGNGLAAMVVLGAIAVTSAKWGIEAFANWSVKRRADRAGVKLELPPVRNPFVDGGPEWLQALLTEAMIPPGKFRPIVLPKPSADNETPDALAERPGPDDPEG